MPRAFNTLLPGCAIGFGGRRPSLMALALLDVGVINAIRRHAGPICVSSAKAAVGAESLINASRRLGGARLPKLC